MTDPVIAAKQRAWESWDWSDNQPVDVLVERAAREALAPLKELHRPVGYGTRGQVVCHTCWDVDGDYHRWPCPSAKHLYPESELP